ncbi:MAG TPA: class I SAM-dependent methyltransferase [Candidatus Limnocylindrales bacterium]
MEGFSASSYGDAIADVYDELFVPDGFEMYGATETADTVEFLAAVAGGGPALEVGAGTGRVALALRERGVEVTAVEVSAQMVERLRAKPGGAELRVIQGDFLTTPDPIRYPLIFAVFNTVIAFQSQERQLAFFARARESLADGGRLVIENVVPPSAQQDALLLRRLAFDHVLASAFSYDRASQVAHKQHILLREGGMRFFPLVSRHIWPSEMDLMARLAGLRLQSRHGGWSGERYTAASARHVSTYTVGDA